MSRHSNRFRRLQIPQKVGTTLTLLTTCWLTTKSQVHKMSPQWNRPVRNTESTVQKLSHF